MWPGLVGKDGDSGQSSISIERMLEFTMNSEVNGRRYDGVDLFLYEPHLNIDAAEDEVRRLADFIAAKDLKIGTVVAPIWESTGGGSAMGSSEERAAFVESVRKACRYAKILNEHGVRDYGRIRIDSATSVEAWAKNPLEGTKLIADTFRRVAAIAEDHGEVLAAEGEICWGAMHSWKSMLDLLEEVGLPERVGFQADLAHTYLYLLGYNAENDALVKEGHNSEEFWAAYKIMTDALRPWTVDFHVAQNDGSVHGSGSHDKTGRHCPADDPNGKLDIVKCASFWLFDEAGKQRPEISHLCWDGCLFDNDLLENQDTWNVILNTMVEVDDMGKSEQILHEVS